MLVGELDEDVFEAGSERANLCDGNAVLQELVAEVIEIETVFDERMDRLAENGCAANAGEVTREAESTRDFGSGDFNEQRAGGLYVGEVAERSGGAGGAEVAVR